MLSHALCEAAINAILALGLTQINSQELFAGVEKKNIIYKWLDAPKILFLNYELPKGTALFGTLKYLTAQRNSFVHSKIQVNYGVEKNFKRSKMRHSVFQNELCLTVLLNE
jgi:hypothetical protein